MLRLFYLANSSTRFLSKIGTKLRDLAIGLVGGQLILLAGIVIKWLKDAVEHYITHLFR